MYHNQPLYQNLTDYEMVLKEREQHVAFINWLFNTSHSTPLPGTRRDLAKLITDANENYLLIMIELLE